MACSRTPWPRVSIPPASRPDSCCGCWTRRSGWIAISPRGSWRRWLGSISLRDPALESGSLLRAGSRRQRGEPRFGAELGQESALRHRAVHDRAARLGRGRERGKIDMRAEIGAAWVVYEGEPHNITNGVPDRCALELRRFLVGA